MGVSVSGQCIQHFGPKVKKIKRKYGGNGANCKEILLLTLMVPVRFGGLCFYLAPPPGEFFMSCS